MQGLVMVNQRRAHIAVLHAQFIEQLEHMQGAMQQLLFPEVLVLSKEEMVLVEQLLPDMRAIGFDITPLSPDSYSIQGVPSQLAHLSAVPVVQDILLQVRERGADTQCEWRDQIALALAKSAAIPYGKTLTEPEMRDLLTRLLQIPSYRRTTDGKVILSLLTNDEINKRFQ
jgi:DNA mismatch repair protein MutL